MNAIPGAIAKLLIFKLHTLVISEMPVCFFGFDGVLVPEYPSYSRAAQQLTVDMVYRCLKCKLIEISTEDWSQHSIFTGDEAFVRELARVDQNKKAFPDSSESRQHALDMGVWLEPQLCCSTAGEALVNRYFPGALDLEGDLRVAQFNDEVCKIFMAHDVPWSTEPLMPLSFRPEL